MSGELFVYAFFGAIFVLAIGLWIHAKSIDSPLENEEYLSENPKLSEVKQKEENDFDE